MHALQFAFDARALQQIATLTLGNGIRLKEFEMFQKFMKDINLLKT